MIVQTKIESITEKKLIGIRMQMNFSNYKIGLLWGKFIPKCVQIKNRISSDLLSLAVYPKSFSFSKKDFNPESHFERWAGVEVNDFEHIPRDMESLVIPAGEYAIFHYKGLNTDVRIFEYIHGEWLPDSMYALDHRPHFEVLGDKYRNGDPNSEENIYIPIRPKK
ncbi:GyrI-like domain-containing protein [Leptospira kirschneri serovar Pomona]|uniref:GyrI-like domain-containing protein n=1 Tax=Leptospira kirschneri serovar Pomona TaxID=561005 RepID=A0A1T1E2P0_9LEPT|nr:GyrI-like domain-containing protein [Leptospira kirschneri]OOV47374.1 GyrI-like domain-containing protein [Leptospira kirschneri serovar Pomona]